MIRYRGNRLSVWSERDGLHLAASAPPQRAQSCYGALRQRVAVQIRSRFSVLDLRLADLCCWLRIGSRQLITADGTDGEKDSHRDLERKHRHGSRYLLCQ